MGADKLLGNGDMLFLWPGTSTLLRGQGTYVSDEEINRIVDCCSTRRAELRAGAGQHQGQGPARRTRTAPSSARLKKRDELYEPAVDLVVREGRGSVSLLQRALGIGYGRAARLIDFMAEDGIVGQYNGSQAREILITLADWERMQGSSRRRAGGFSCQCTRSPLPRRRRSGTRSCPSRGEEEEAEESDRSEADEGDEEVEEDAFAEDADDEEARDYRAESA